MQQCLRDLLGCSGRYIYRVAQKSKLLYCVNSWLFLSHPVQCSAWKGLLADLNITIIRRTVARILARGREVWKLGAGTDEIRRAEARGLKGRQRGRVLGEGQPSPPQQLGDLVKRCKLLQRERGGDPAVKLPAFYRRQMVIPGISKSSISEDAALSDVAREGGIRYREFLGHYFVSGLRTLKPKRNLKT